MSKKETAKFIVQLIASIATAILTALGATSCVGAERPEGPQMTGDRAQSELSKTITMTSGPGPDVI